MRCDMHHLLVERGHAGTGYTRFQPKGWKARCRLRYGDDEVELDSWVEPHRQPNFSENLAPLRRYLAAQVGRPWDKVYAEIRSRIDAGNAVQYHILQHLYDDLAVQVTEDADGRLWYSGRWGHPQRLGGRWGPDLYVCPRSGLLRKVRRRPIPKQYSPTADHLPGSSSDHDFRLIAGQWYEAWWGRDPVTAKPVILRKRQLNRRELRDLGLRS